MNKKSGWLPWMMPSVTWNAFKKVFVFKFCDTEHNDNRKRQNKPRHQKAQQRRWNWEHLHYIQRLFPLNSRAAFFLYKSWSYHRQNKVCNFFATRYHFDSKICLAKPGENQTPFAYKLCNCGVFFSCRIVRQNFAAPHSNQRMTKTDSPAYSASISELSNLRRVCIYSTVDGEISRTADGLRQYLGRLANAVASNTQWLNALKVSVAAYFLSQL